MLWFKTNISVSEFVSLDWFIGCHRINNLIWKANSMYDISTIFVAFFHLFLSCWLLFPYYYRIKKPYPFQWT
jgi:hypothetical protein